MHNYSFQLTTRVLLRERKRHTARRAASTPPPPTPGVDRQTPVKTVPCPILRMRAVTNESDKEHYNEPLPMGLFVLL